MSLMEKRFGTVAVNIGMITLPELEEGLRRQEKDNKEGRQHRLIGSIFQDLGYMDEEQVAEILLKMVEE